MSEPVSVRLSAPLAWLLDAAAEAPGADRLLAELGGRLCAEGLPVAAGTLTLDVSHPLIARRGWLWRADSGEIVESLGFAGLAQGTPQGDAERRWLAGFGPVHDVGGDADRPRLGWAGSRAFSAAEVETLRLVARFAAAPLAAISARATLAATLEAYLGRRSVVGERIEAALLFADLRGFTPLSESLPPEQVIAALDGWFDRIAGAVHAFGGEVLKFIGDGVLAIFPVTGGLPRPACAAALRALGAAKAGMTRLDEERRRDGLPALPFGAALHLGPMLWGNIGAANRLDFTAIGPAVNLVSRLEGLCKPLGRWALVSGALAGEVEAPLEPLGRHELRGIREPCEVFAPVEA
jgi:class 3 adenylate cyclase